MVTSVPARTAICANSKGNIAAADQHDTLR
jgi:hypothetical protein